MEANRAATDKQIDVWVVDNASSDGSAAAVRQTFPAINVIETGKNLGFAAGNNVALKCATGRYCLLLNSDTLVPVGTFHALVRNMDESPQTAVCSPLLLNADGSPQICWARFQNVLTELTGQLDRSQSEYPVHFIDTPERRVTLRSFVVDWVGGACFLVRREAIDDVGLMDEGFFMYSEETEWCHRFAQHGWETRLIPSVTVTHLGGSSSNQVKAATRERMHRSILRLYKIMYGTWGAMAPSAIATVRYGAYHVRNFVRQKITKPVH